MKLVLGILLLANVTLLLWGLGQREFVYDKHSPAIEFHPELMNVLPAAQPRTMAKVVIETDGNVTTSNADRDRSNQAEVEFDDPAEVAPGQCMLIGPFKSALARGRTGRQLQDMSISFSESDEPQRQVLGYRIYQGPFSSKDDLIRAKHKLEKQGVKDIYLMNEGAGSRLISLGFFSNKKSAGVFMQDIAALDVESKQREEFVTHYWIKVSDIEAVKQLNRRSAVPLPSGITKLIKACGES